MGCLTCCHGLPIDTVPPLNGANRPPSAFNKRHGSGQKVQLLQHSQCFGDEDG